MEKIIQKLNITKYNTSFYRKFSNFHIKSTQLTQNSTSDPSTLGFLMGTDSSTNPSIKTDKDFEKDLLNNLLNDSSLSFAGFYNLNSLNYLLTSGIITFIRFAFEMSF